MLEFLVCKTLTLCRTARRFLFAAGAWSVQDCSRMLMHASIKTNRSPRNHAQMQFALRRHPHPRPRKNLRGGLARTRVRRAATADSVASTVVPLGTTIQTPSSILSNTVPPAAEAGRGDRAWRSRFSVGRADNRLGPFVVARRVTSPVHSKRVTTALPCTVEFPRKRFTDGLPRDRTEASALPTQQLCPEFPPEHRSATRSALADSGH